ncbi:MAG: hypothetical protein ACREX5_10865 [Achromobacter pestifer]
MSNRVRLYQFKPATIGAQFSLLGVAIKWSLGMAPPPSALMVDGELFQLAPRSEIQFWKFAIRLAFVGVALIVTRNGTWDPSGTVDSGGVHAFGQDFELRID